MSASVHSGSAKIHRTDGVQHLLIVLVAVLVALDFISRCLLSPVPFDIFSHQAHTRLEEVLKF